MAPSALEKSYFYSSFAQLEMIFEALSAAEKGGISTLSLSQKQSLMFWRGWGSKTKRELKDCLSSYPVRIAAKNADIKENDFLKTFSDNHLESYYTPPELVVALWKSLEHLGVPVDAKILEPGCGSGLFFAGAPDSFKSSASFIGVERDPFAARLARVMNPDALILNSSLEQTPLQNSFSAVIGNVPFGETRLSDGRYKNSRIHDYFLQRGLDALAPNGIMAVLVSSGSMDKKNSAIRASLYGKADLCAAFRLPIELFSDQNTQVTTDLLILQKRPVGVKPGYDFTQTTVISGLRQAGKPNSELLHDDSFLINRYFQEHPEHIFGDLSYQTSAFGPKLCVSAPLAHKNPQALADQVLKAVQSLPANLFAGAHWEPVDDADRFNLASQDAQVQSDKTSERLKDYSGFIGDFFLRAGHPKIISDLSRPDQSQILRIADRVVDYDSAGVGRGYVFLVESVDVPEKQQQLLVAYIDLRDHVRALLRMQLDGSDQDLLKAQQETQKSYEDFYKKFGSPNKRSNQLTLSDDPGFSEVSALEFWDYEKQQRIGLSDILSKRVIDAEVQPRIESAQDALFWSLNRCGRVDLSLMESVSGITEVDLIKELSGRKIFKNPENLEWEHESLYLSGNVFKKLERARSACLQDAMLSSSVLEQSIHEDRANSIYEDNVHALSAILPDPVPFDEITFGLGSPWIPQKDVEDFVRALLNAKNESFFQIERDAGGYCTVQVSDSFKGAFLAMRTSVFGSEKAPFEKLLEKKLNNEKPVHYKENENGVKVVDEDATMDSRAKQDEINSAFCDWVAASDGRMQRYEKMHNELFNVYVTPKVNGSELTFPGMSAHFHPRPHQLDMIATTMMGYNTMAAHPVGAGKTFEMVASAIKMKQIGKHQKPAIAVPNHMLGQINREAKQIFPLARILMVTNEDLSKDNRKRFLAMARNNDWDLIVMTHSLLNSLSAPDSVVLDEIDMAIATCEDTLQRCQTTRMKRQKEASLKTLINQKEKKIKEVEEAVLSGKKAYFHEFGIDCLFVDEAHLYKNLDLFSSMKILGIPGQGSARSSNLKNIGQYLREKHQGSQGLHFYTATPIANSTSELYVHLKILRPEIWEDMGIHTFDQFANTFAEPVTSLEPLPEGGGYKVGERLTRYVNLPELLKAFRSVADVRSASDLNLPTPKVNTFVSTVLQTDWQKDHMQHLANRAIGVRSGLIKPEVDNILKIATDGRKAATSLTLVDSLIPEEASLKIMACANNVFENWAQTHTQKGTQLVFCDLGTPGKHKTYSAYDQLRNNLAEKGIPKEEIAFIHEAGNEKKKNKLFADVNSGRVRVLIGSTEKMGVGMNVQERLCALHQLDCPWRPADIKQRLGRIDRQGNQYFLEVKDYRYTTQDSFDLFMWATNERKARFIEQAMCDPNSVGRELREDIDLGYAEVMEVTTGDPKIKEKVQLDEEVRQLKRSLRSFIASQSSLKKKIDSFSFEKSLEETSLKDLYLLHEALPRVPVKAVTFYGDIYEVQDGPATHMSATGIGEALNRKVSSCLIHMQKNNLYEIDLNARIGDIHLILERGFGGQALVRPALMVGNELKTIRGKLCVEVGKHARSNGIALRSFYDVIKSIEVKKQNIAHLSEQIDVLKASLVDGAWPKEALLKDTQERKAALDKYLSEKEQANSSNNYDPFLIRLSELRLQKDMEEDALKDFLPRDLLADVDQRTVQSDSHEYDIEAFDKENEQAAFGEKVVETPRAAFMRMSN